MPSDSPTPDVVVSTQPEPSPALNGRIFWPILIAIVAVDIVTKAVAVRALAPARIPHDLIGDYLRFTLVVTGEPELNRAEVIRDGPRAGIPWRDKQGARREFEGCCVLRGSFFMRRG